MIVRKKEPITKERKKERKKVNICSNKKKKIEKRGNDCLKERKKERKKERYRQLK